MTLRLPPSVPGNLRRLHANDVEQASARQGPVSVGPGEGSTAYHDGTRDWIILSGAGVEVRYGEGMFALTPLLEAKADTSRVDQQVGSLQTQINENDTKRSDGDASLQTQVNTKASESSVASRIGSLQTQINENDGKRSDGDASLQTQVNAKASESSVASRIGSLQGQINDNDDKRSSGDTALSQRISALEGETHASPNDIAALQAEIHALESRIEALENWRNQYPWGLIIG